MAAGSAGPGGRNIVLKSAAEIAIMGEANQIVADTLIMLEEVVDVGVTTWELDRLAEEMCSRRGQNRHLKDTAASPEAFVFRSTKRWCTGSPRKRKS
jgi:methionyl aminopeptidase